VLVEHHFLIWNFSQPALLAMTVVYVAAAS